MNQDYKELFSEEEIKGFIPRKDVSSAPLFKRDPHLSTTIYRSKSDRIYNIGDFMRSHEILPPKGDNTIELPSEEEALGLLAVYPVIFAEINLKRFNKSFDKKTTWIKSSVEFIDKDKEFGFSVIFDIPLFYHQILSSREKKLKDLMEETTESFSDFISEEYLKTITDYYGIWRLTGKAPNNVDVSGLEIRANEVIDEFISKWKEILI